MKKTRQAFLQRAALLYKVLDTLRNVLIVLIFSFIIVAGASAVFLRYMPELRGLPWVDEVLRYLNIWVVFLGASVAIKRGSHLKVDFFIRKFFSARTVTIIRKLTLIIILICLSVLISASTKKFLGSLNVVIQAAPVSIAVFYLAVPLGCGLMFLDYLLILICGEHPFKAPNPEDGER